MEGPAGVPELEEPMPCYEFNGFLRPAADDGHCDHCRKFLTVECEYVDRFLDEEGAE